MRRYSRRGVVLGVTIGATPLRAGGEGMRVAVKDPTGAGVEGAIVILSQHQKDKPSTAGERDVPTVAAMGTTGKEGLAEFPFGELPEKRAIKGRRYTVEVRSHGFLPVTRTGVIATAGVIDVTLQVGFFVIY
jgi:hypothetical protein